MPRSSLSPHANEDISILYNGKSLPFTIFNQQARNKQKLCLPNTSTRHFKNRDCLPFLLQIIPGAKALRHPFPNVEMSPAY